MNCDEVIESLPDFVYDEVEAEVAAELGGHLKSCPRCAAEAAALRSTRKLLDQWTAPFAPVDMTAVDPAVAARVVPAASAPNRSWRDLRAAVVGAAAALLVLAVFVWLPARSPSSGRDAAATSRDSATDQYMLFLLEPASDATRDPSETRRLVAEYRGWAQEVQRSGRAIAGAKLAAPQYLLPESEHDSEPRDESPAGTDEVVTGYFRVEAESLEEALRIARTCPHVKHGGRIEVRRIDPRTRE